MTQLIGIEALAAQTGFNKYTIYKWCTDKKIPHVRMPGNDIRFNKQKIEEWIELRTVKQRNPGAAPLKKNSIHPLKTK